MTVEHLPLSGALLLTTRVFDDERGSFRELFSLDRYPEFGIADAFVQDNASRSRRDVLRGLHGDDRMSKIVAVLRGRAFDVIVDARSSSPTYGGWFGTELDAETGRQVYVPRGFLHGFLALEDDTIVWYKQSAGYDPSAEISVAWDDADLGIAWPLGGAEPILSRRDRANPSFRSLAPLASA